MNLHFILPNVTILLAETKMALTLNWLGEMEQLAHLQLVEKNLCHPFPFNTQPNYWSKLASFFPGYKYIDRPGMARSWMLGGWNNQRRENNHLPTTFVFRTLISITTQNHWNAQKTFVPQTKSPTCKKYCLHIIRVYFKKRYASKTRKTSIKDMIKEERHNSLVHWTHGCKTNVCPYSEHGPDKHLVYWTQQPRETSVHHTQYDRWTNQRLLKTFGHKNR